MLSVNSPLTMHDLHSIKTRYLTTS